MPQQYEPSPELIQFETELMSRSLPGALVDRDQLIYHAGYEAGRNSAMLAEVVIADGSLVATSGSTSNRKWQRLSLALVTLSAVLGLVILRGFWVPPIDPPLAKIEISDSSGIMADASQSSAFVRDFSNLSEHDLKNHQDVGPDEPIQRLASADQSPIDSGGIESTKESDKLVQDDSIEVVAGQPPGGSNWLERWLLGSFSSERTIEQQRANRRGFAMRNFEIEPFRSPVSFESNWVEPSDDNDRPIYQPPRLGDLLKEILEEI